MKIDQVAYYAPTDAASKQIKEWLGLADKEWVTDLVTALSMIDGYNQKVESIGLLEFNYDLGIELEILRYISGPHWHVELNPLFRRSRNSEKAHHKPLIFASHVGIHLADGEPFPEMFGVRLVQETWTQSHTGKYLTDPSSPGFGRTYHYRIHELSPGTYIKYIRRIHPKKG